MVDHARDMTKLHAEYGDMIISLAKDEDGGQYVCEMGTGGGEAIKHTVHIRGEFVWREI